jgi:hypothetical protein
LIRTSLRKLTLLALAGGFCPALPASHADTCTISMTVWLKFHDIPFVYIDDREVTTPPVTVPCPGPQDQPAATPAWVTTDVGPGYNSDVWFWARVKRGGHLYFVNTHDVPHAYRGAGFDSGWVQPGGVAEVWGVPFLNVGYYKVYDIDGGWYGELYVDP